jgi:hypothetical protein
MSSPLERCLMAPTADFLTDSGHYYSRESPARPWRSLFGDLPEQEPVMRRSCLVFAAFLFLTVNAAPAARAASAQPLSTSEGRTTLDVKALFGWISEVFAKAFATADTGPVIDPWGRATADEGPHIDPLGRD